jgi:hypothetical protein
LCSFNKCFSVHATIAIKAREESLVHNKERRCLFSGKTTFKQKKVRRDSLSESGSDVHFNDSNDADVDADDEDAACLFCAGLHSEDKHRDRWA